MKRIERIAVVVVAFFVVLGLAASPRASAQEKKPNISSWVTTLGGSTSALITRG
jgi:hypothetical protein